MNTPVNFEIAKLLTCTDFKSIGACYTLPDGIYYISSNLLNPSITGKEKPQFISAPTISEVVMWIYEKHGIWISVTLELELHITFCYQIIGEYTSASYKAYFNSPTEAYEAGIEYCLTKLIKEEKK